MTGDTSRSTAQEDRRAIADYRARHGEGPFLASDAVVTSGDARVLLIRRSRAPGRGLLALPGGFVDRDETFLAAALRELHEETGLRLARADRAGAAPMRLRDDPERDPRARIVSVAYHFALSEPAASLIVAAADDAAEAAWQAIADLPGADAFFADHHAILRSFDLVAE